MQAFEPFDTFMVYKTKRRRSKISPIRKLKRQVFAKKSIAGTMTIFVLIFLASLASIIVIVPERVVAAPAWNEIEHIVINHTMIDTNLTNFPILVVINSTIGAECDGGDSIRFNNSDNTTEFAYEIDLWNDSDDSYVWVNVTSVSSTEDTIIWMRYNNSDASDAQNPTGVWNDEYKVVLHMSDYSTTQTNDSTQYLNHGTKQAANEPDEVNSNIGKGQYFDASGDYLNCGTDNELNQTDFVTVELYLSVTNVDNPDNIYSVISRKDNAQIFNLYDTGEIGGLYYKTTGTRYLLVSTFLTPFSNGETGYMAFTFAGTDLEYWHNLEKSTGSETTAASAYNNDDDLQIGGRTDDGTYTFNGIIDEYRWSNIKRNDSWLNATFHSVNQTTGFIVVGTPPVPNNVPTITNEYPPSGSTGIPVNPNLHVQVNDTDAEQMNITWKWWNYTNNYFANNSFYLGFYKLNMQQGVHINQNGHNETYICYMGEPSYDPRIIMYNHITCEWTNDVLIDDIAPNSKGGPSIFINDSGYIYMFYDFHTASPKMKVSNNPYDIGTSSGYWTADTWAGGDDHPSYAHAINVGDNEIFVFYRYKDVNGDRPWKYIYSDDGGDSWDAAVTYLDTTDGNLGESYMYGVKYYNDKIHMVWHRATHDVGDGSKIQNVYYMYFNVTDKHFYNITNSDLGATVTTDAEIDSCLVYNSSSSPYGFQSLAGRVDVDTNENPYIIFMYANANDEDHYSWNFTYWNGSNWSIDPSTDALWNITDDSVIRDSSSGTITVYSPTDVRMYVPVNRSIGHPANNPGGDIEQWDWNGTSLVFNQTVMAEDDYSYPLNMGPVIQNATDDFRFIACEYDLTATGAPKLFGWSKDNEFIYGHDKTWYTFGVNTSVDNGTYYQTNSNFSEYNTVYHWSVSVTDGTDWINETYYFTSKLENEIPEISNPVPENGSWMNTDNITEQFNITINDADGDMMNITWWTNASGTWEQFNETLNVGNGTYNATNLSWIDDCNITYYWSVNVTDGTAWNNSTFHFDVECKVTLLHITARTTVTDVVKIADAVSSVVGIILIIFAVMGIITIVSKFGQ